MATFVLVHGAWHGGWCWKKLTPLLRAAGHEVVAPTLTGLGERVHLLTREVGLDTHVQDVVNVLEYEELHDVALVGHSNGGMVITGVAERVPERVRHLVYLDAVVPMDEERSFKELTLRHDPDRWSFWEEQIRAGDGWLLPVPTGEPLMGVTDEEDLRWLRAHLTAHPAKTLLQRLAGDHAPARHLPRTFIRCPETPGAPNPSSPHAERIRQAGGQCHELAGGHDIMVTMPHELSTLLTTAIAA